LNVVKVAIVGAAAVALVAAGTAAGAAIRYSPRGGSGVIHGCYSKPAINGSHRFMLQNARTACPPGYSAISWNQKGSAGPAGPSTAGPSGLNVITKVNVGTASPQPSLAVAICPADHPYLIDGGGSAGISPQTGGNTPTFMGTDSPLNDVLEKDGGSGFPAGATTVDVAGMGSPGFTAGMTVTFEPDTPNAESDTLTSVTNTGTVSVYDPEGTVYQWTLATPLVHSHANDTIVQGPGWEVTSNGRSTAWAYCSK
jgi:hypothetical protein